MSVLGQSHRHGHVCSLAAVKVREKLTALGVDPMIMSPTEFDAYVLKDIGASAALVKSAAIKPEW
jgi:hypothetical protein